MNINTRNMNFVKFNNQEMEWVKFNGITVWEGWKTLIAQGIPPISLQKCANKNLVGYQIYGNSKQGRLPEGYTELEYIESTGEQYIDTGITATNNTGMSIKYRYTAEGSAAISGIFKGTNPRRDTFFISSQTGTLPGTGFIAHKGNTTGTTLGDISLNTDYTAKINYKNDGKIYYNEDYITDIGTNSVYNATIPIFARLNASNQDITASNSRIYYVEFTEGNTISHNFIPAKNSSGTIGMYDLVNNVFYTNAGTGTFTAGPEIDLPDGYIKLDYIEATGEQYIDTGISPDANTQVDYKVRFKEDATAASPLMGARVGNTNYCRYFPIAYNNPNTEYRTAFGVTTGTVGTIDFNIDYEGSFQPQNEVSIINGTSYSLAGHGFRKSSDYNLYLFATLGYSDNLYQAKGVIYYVKIYQNGVLVRNLIPCKTNQGEVGMYDTVNHTFYSNQGTGSFVGGTVSEIQSVGDLVTDTTDINYGKYKIPVSVNNVITNIYLSEPLRKIGDYVDYLDYENQKVYRNVTPTFDSKTTTEESVTLPDILLNKGTNVVDVGTSVTPSNLWLKYKGKN